MLMINNQVVAQVLTMRECIAAQETAFAGLLKGESIFRPRIDTYVPCAREDGYYRFGTVEGASGGYYAVRLKSDIVHWPKGPDGGVTESKYCVQPGTFCGLVLLYACANGEPLAIMNDGEMQHMRVGGAAGIGTRLLAREDASTVGMIGSQSARGSRLTVTKSAQTKTLSTPPISSSLATSGEQPAWLARV